MLAAGSTALDSNFLSYHATIWFHRWLPCCCPAWKKIKSLVKFPHFYIFSRSTRPCFLQFVLVEVWGTWTEVGFLLISSCSISFHWFLKNFLLVVSQSFRVCSRLMLYPLYVSESDTKTFLQHVPNRNTSTVSRETIQLPIISVTDLFWMTHTTALLQFLLTRRAY